MKEQQKNDLPKWDLEAIYPTPAAWESDFGKLRGLAEDFASYKGRLAESAAVLAEALKKDDVFSRLAEKVYVFRFDHEEGSSSDIMPNAYSFRDKVPIGISQGSCAVDFQKIRQKLQRLKMLEGY